MCAADPRATPAAAQRGTARFTGCSVDVEVRQLATVANGQGRSRSVPRHASCAALKKAPRYASRARCRCTKGSRHAAHRFRPRIAGSTSPLMPHVHLTTRRLKATAYIVVGILNAAGMLQREATAPPAARNCRTRPEHSAGTQPGDRLNRVGAEWSPTAAFCPRRVAWSRP